MSDKIWQRNMQRIPEEHVLTEVEIREIAAEADRLVRDEGMELKRAEDRAERKFWLGLLR